MRFIYLVILITVSQLAFAQGPDPRIAKTFFKDGNYTAAIPEYYKLLKVERNNTEYLMEVAICYLESYIDRGKAVEYLERAIAEEKFDKECYYYLGLGYMYQLEYEKAIEAFNTYKENSGKFEDQLEKLLRDCHTAKELVKFPVNVDIKNMGDKINSPYPDYYPFVTANEEKIVFTSRRKEGKGSIEFDGFYPSDVWLCTYDGNIFTPAKNAKGINGSTDESCVGITDSGDSIFLYIDNYITGEYGNVYTAIEKGRVDYTKKKPMFEKVNSKEIESAASISSDGNVILFSSMRDGGYGGLDLYMIRKLPNGEWAEPQNLGPEINTADHEDFPVFGRDGRTIYFSSKGHPGMGDYDLFKTVWNPRANKFSAVENLGYPINTPYEDRTISFAGDGKHAYTSGFRMLPGDNGEREIYRITFKEVEVRPASFIVNLPTADTANPLIKDAMIYVFSEEGEEIGSYTANQNTGNYVIILAPGNYMMDIEAPGYQIYSEDLKVSEFHYKLGLIEKKIKLTPE